MRSVFFKESSIRWKLNSIFVQFQARPSSKAPNWSATSSSTRVKSPSSAHSKVAENDSHLILIYGKRNCATGFCLHSYIVQFQSTALTFAFTLATDLTYVPLMAATRNSPNQQISSLTSSRMLKPSKICANSIIMQLEFTMPIFHFDL